MSETRELPDIVLRCHGCDTQVYGFVAHFGKDGQWYCTRSCERSFEAGRLSGAEEERAACARIADGADTLVGRVYQPDHPRVSQRIARQIRMRGLQGAHRKAGKP